MKFAADRPWSDPEKAARKLVEIANSVEVVQDGRIYIELINGPFLFREKGTPKEYKAGLDLAVERGWLELHDSGTFVKFTKAGLTCSPDQSARSCAPDIRREIVEFSHRVAITCNSAAEKSREPAPWCPD